MNVAEGLEELRVNLLKDDAGLASGPDDRLWSDETLIRYWNDGIRRFARTTLTLRDSTTPEVCQVRLQTGVTEYSLHPAVRAVISARYDTSVYDLSRVGHSLLGTPPRTVDTLGFDVNARDTWQPGPALTFNTDETLDMGEDSAVVLRVWPAPSADEDGKIIYLRVARMPLKDLTLEKPLEFPEIPPEYQLDTLEWAAYRAFRTGDVDGSSEKASMHRTRFEEVMGEALKEQRRKMFAPVTWGFGRNGFSWSTGY